MPLKLSQACKVCQYIQYKPDGDVLAERLYRSNKFYKTGELLTNIQKDYKEFFSYRSLREHLKNHQAINDADLKKATMKKLEKNTVSDMVSGDVVRQAIMEKGIKQIKSGKIKLKGSDVVKAAKDQDELTLKRKDQQIEITKMLLAFSSGEMENWGENGDNRPIGSGATADQFIDSDQSTDSTY